MRIKYQEALDDLSLEVKGLEQNESIKILQELVDKETPRTEQEILKDFEALGYLISKNNYHLKFLENELDDLYITIDITFSTKSYSAYLNNGTPATITMQEHKLLNELFHCWGWF